MTYEVQRFFHEGYWVGRWHSIRFYETESACRRYIKWLVRTGRAQAEDLRIQS